jgi:hypothetical protein
VEELSASAKIALSMMILGMLFASVFLILGVTQGLTSQGVNNLQNNSNQLTLAQYDPYDQKVVYGNQVLSAIKLFAGDPLAIVTRTTLQEQAASNTGFNYGAILTGTDATTFVTQPMTKAAGQSWYVSSLAGNGTLTYNQDTLATIQTGTNQYISPTGQFLSELIEDGSGNIIGICFTQQS